MDDFCPCIHASASGPAAVQREQRRVCMTRTAISLAMWVFQGFSSHVLLVVPLPLGLLGPSASLLVVFPPSLWKRMMRWRPAHLSVHHKATVHKHYLMTMRWITLWMSCRMKFLCCCSVAIQLAFLVRVLDLFAPCPRVSVFLLFPGFRLGLHRPHFFLSLCSATGLEPSMLVPLLSPRFCVSAAPPCRVPGCGGFGRPLDFHCATTCASSGPVGIGFRKLCWMLSPCGDCFMSKFMCACSLSSWCNWFLELWLCFARRCTHRTEPVPAIRDTSPSRVWQSSAPQQMFDLRFWKSVPASL